MYGLHFREELPDAVQRELDTLVAWLRGFLLEEHNEDGTHVSGGHILDFVPVGAITAYGAATPPTGWLMCNGAQVSRVTYKGLFDVIGTTYGAGDGSTTFTLPNFQGRFPLGKATSGTGSTLGETGGTISHTHNVSDHTHSFGAHTHTIPSQAGHAHTISADGSHSHGGSTDSGGGGTTDGPSSTTSVEQCAVACISVASETHTHTVSAHTHGISADGSHSHGGSTGTEPSHDHGGVTGATGGTTELGGAQETTSANPPFQVINYIIFAGV
jgi:microcystin-dependent protein